MYLLLGLWLVSFLLEFRRISTPTLFMFLCSSVEDHGIAVRSSVFNVPVDRYRCMVGSAFI